nr:ATP-binding protein [uncultured Anaeromusa sp.]
MSRPLRYQIWSRHIGIIILALLLAFAGSYMLIRQYVLEQRTADLVRKGTELTQLVAASRQQEDGYQELRQLVEVLDPFLDARIWVVDRQGRILALSGGMMAPAAGGTHFNHGDAMPHGRGMMQGQGQGPGLGMMMQGGARLVGPLQDVLQGQIVRRTFFHDFYQEQMLVVAVPVPGPETGSTDGAVVLHVPLQGVEAWLQRVRWHLGVVAVICLLASLVVGQRLSRQIARPLESLRQATQHIAGGEYHRRVPVEGPAELVDVAQSFNAMAASLEQSALEMEKQEGLRRDFVANVSHELRTPLTIIRGYNEALADGTAAEQQRQQYHALIRDEAMRLERLIADLLDISRLRAGVVEMERESILLQSLVDGVVQLVEKLAQEKDLRLETKLSEGLLVYGDGDRLTQLLLILLDNALRHTEQGTVYIESGRDGDSRVFLRISDTGHGIPAEALPYIWERFYKVDKAHSRDGGGTGLGLAVAKEIMNLHGIDVEATSIVGAGTTFTLRFSQG